MATALNSQSCSTPNLQHYETHGLSLQKWAASTSPLNTEMATQGLRTLFQPLPLPKGSKIQPSSACTGVLLGWRFAVSPIHTNRAILDLHWCSWGHLYSSMGFSLLYTLPPLVHTKLCQPSGNSQNKQAGFYFQQESLPLTGLAFKAIFFIWFFQIPSTGEKKKDIIYYITC